MFFMAVNINPNSAYRVITGPGWTLSHLLHDYLSHKYLTQNIDKNIILVNLYQMQTSPNAELVAEQLRIKFSRAQCYIKYIYIVSDYFWSLRKRGQLHI